MPRARLIVREQDSLEEPARVDTETLTLEGFRQTLRSGAYLGMLRRYETVELHLYSMAAQGRLWPYAFLLPPLSRRGAVIRDDEGQSMRVRLPLALKLATDAVRDRIGTAALMSRFDRALDTAVGTPRGRRCDPSLPALYLRTDLKFGDTASGAVGHIAGVLNGLLALGAAPLVVTTDPIPTVDPDVETHIVRPGERFRNLGELRAVALNEVFVPGAEMALGTRRPGFVYQRNSAFNFSGLALAARYGVCLVLEYNGSHIWIERNWRDGLRHEALAERVEDANLRNADLVVVGSVPLRDEVVARGVDPARVLIDPTGVDTDIYSPNVDGRGVREKLGLGSATVIGFVGTFGRWHGAEVLADAFGLLIEKAPDLRASVRLLMVGDGVMMPEVVANLERRGVRDLAILTGLVPQAEGPAYLAACDIVASPHVPNADGTPFFGSPMKLFEYMAMGKAIIASDLGQIGEVLENDRSAVLVPPADADALAADLERLVRDAGLRDRIGAAARQDAVDHHTWRQHTQRILDALRTACGAGL
jgi:glycosyltransferase involved in cell wall biosynthesis